VAEVAATPIPMPPATTEATERLVPQNAITVLTFANLNPTTDNMEFGAALGRAITTRLRESDNLALASEQADARYVVSGGIQTVGPSVRVTARIVDSDNSAVLHALKVDGAIEDRVKVQSEVAEAVYKHVLLLDNQSETTRTSNVQTLAIRPFEQLNGPADNDRTTNINLGDAITSAVTAQLANLSSVAIVDSETRASLIIGGGIQTASNSVIRAFKVDGTATDLAELQEQLAAAVAESVTQTIANNLVTTRTENSVSTISHRSQP
jgi:TolB-like protein